MSTRQLTRHRRLNFAGRVSSCASVWSSLALATFLLVGGEKDDCVGTKKVYQRIRC